MGRAVPFYKLEQGGGKWEVGQNWQTDGFLQNEGGWVFTERGRIGSYRTITDRFLQNDNGQVLTERGQYKIRNLTYRKNWMDWTNGMAYLCVKKFG